MAKNIDSLLKKKGWSGVEVGKALVASIVHDIKHQSEPDYKPLFSQSDFDKMEQSLNTERDYLAYGVYRDIYSGLIDAFNRGQGQYQQFYNGYYRYLMHLRNCQAENDAIERAELMPYVMTEEQYNKLKSKAEERLQGTQESFNSLLLHLLSYFMENPEEAPEDIKKAIEATKGEPVKNKRVLDQYNELYGLGYYQLPDGTRSTQFEGEGWQDRLKADYLRSHKLYINGELASWEDTVLHYNTERRLKGYELFYKGLPAVKSLYKEHTGEELPAEEEAGIMKALENILGNGERGLAEAIQTGNAPLHPAVLHIKELLEGELADGAEWHYNEEPPADLTKFDILEEMEFYNGADSEDGEPHTKEFKVDYPALYKALEAYIKEIIPQAGELKPAQYSKDLISWGELAKLNIANYAGYITANEHDILEEIPAESTADLITRRRILLNGIAIAKEPRAYQLNESGEFIDNLDSILALPMALGLDSIAGSETQREDITAFQEHLFKPALRYLYAFNTLVKILGQVYDLEEMGEVELKTTTFERQLDNLNNMLYMLYGEIYGTAEEKERKRELIKEIFSPVDYEGLKPTPEAIDAVTTELDRMGFSSEARKKLKKFDRLIDELCEGGL